MCRYRIQQPYISMKRDRRPLCTQIVWGDLVVSATSIVTEDRLPAAGTEHRTQHSENHETAIATEQDVRCDVLRGPRYVCFLDLSFAGRWAMLQRHPDLSAWPTMFSMSTRTRNSIFWASTHSKKTITHATICVMCA